MHYFLRNHGINVKIRRFSIKLCVLSRTTVQWKCGVAFPHSWLGTIEDLGSGNSQSKQQEATRSMLNLLLHAVLRLALPKIASWFKTYEHVAMLIHFFIMTCTYVGIRSCSGKTTNLCIHTVHMVRHARLFFAWIDWQPVNWATHCIRQAETVYHNMECRMRRQIQCASAYLMLRCIPSFTADYFSLIEFQEILGMKCRNSQSKISFLGIDYYCSHVLITLINLIPDLISRISRDEVSEFQAQNFIPRNQLSLLL